MPMYGADSDQLDELARRFESSSVLIRDAAQRLTSQLATSPWQGQKADAFRADWGHRHRRDLVTVFAALSVARDALRRNAAEQRAVSAAERGFANVFAQALGAAEARSRELEAARALADQHLDELRRMYDATPAEQAAWWASLSLAAQAALLLLESGRLTGLAGLPSDVLARARQNYIDQRKDDIVVSSSNESVAGSVDIAWVELSAEASAEVTEFADGHAEVSLTLRGEIGAQVGEGGDGAKAESSVAAGGEVTMNYRFASRAEADSFLAGLKRELIPNGGEAARAFVGGAAWLAADAAHDVKAYLDSQSSHYESTTFRGDISGKVEIKAGPVDIEIEGSAYASYNTVSGTTLGLELKGNVAADIGIASAGASASVGLDVAVAKDGTLESLTIKGEITADGSVDFGKFFGDTGGLPAGEVGAGGRMSFEAKVDLSDPFVQERAGHLIKAAAAGDPAAGQAILALVREAEVTVALDATTSNERSTDLVVAEVSHEKSSSTNVVTYMKPPGGGWVTYRTGGQ